MPIFKSKIGSSLDIKHEESFYKGIYKFHSSWFSNDRRMFIKTHKNVEHGITISFYYEIKK